MREQAGEDVEQMKSAGWRKPDAPILSGRTLIYTPSENETAREGQATRNWRHNLSRSSKYGNVVSVWSAPDPDEMRIVYEAMQSYKNLPEQLSHSALISLLETFGKQCIVLRCDDAQGRLLAFLGALVFGTKAWGIVGAASPEARKVYASYAVFWGLMRQCAQCGVRWYDTSGADPLGNKGVYDFKKGSGASDFFFLGEWDWATSSPLRRAANYMIKRRGGGM